MKRLILAGIVTLGAFTAIAVTAPKAYAIDCITTCQDCEIVYLDCGACGGEACSGWGAACRSFCWTCGNGDHGCAPAG